MKAPLDVVIDTDIGDDIDDALALAFACLSPEVRLRAVTTVYGRTDLRTKLATAVLEACGVRNVPVAAGYSKPIVEEEPLREPLQFKALKPGEGEEGIVKEHAIDLLLEVSREYEGLTLITLGPLTNVALALLREPSLAKRVRIISMAGCYLRPTIEYNVRCDPEAMYVLLRSGAKPLLVGLDVTTRCVMGLDKVEELKRSPCPHADVLSRLLGAWMEREVRKPVLHDPLAVATSLREDLVETLEAEVTVELCGKATRGLTLLAKGGFKARVCVDVREEEFLKLFYERLIVGTCRSPSCLGKLDTG